MFEYFSHLQYCFFLSIPIYKINHNILFLIHASGRMGTLIYLMWILSHLCNFLRDYITLVDKFNSSIDPSLKRFFISTNDLQINLL